jgi:hypothetical protein
VCHPQDLTLGSRFGFVRLAIQHGAHLIPGTILVVGWSLYKHSRNVCTGMSTSNVNVHGCLINRAGDAVGATCFVFESRAVFTFGENDLYKQALPNPPGSIVRYIQETMMSVWRQRARHRQTDRH